MGLLECFTCIEKHKNKVSEENRELKKQIAMLKDGFEYQKDMADVYAKALRRFENWLDCKISEAEENGENYSMINLMDLEELKNSIPETALRRN